MTLSGNASFTTGDFHVGQGGGVGSVTVNGGTFVSNGWISVGDGGTGTMTINAATSRRQDTSFLAVRAVRCV